MQKAVAQAEEGLTVRLGSDFALAEIRYVVLPDGIAPSLPGVQAPPSVPPPPVLIEALQAQSDLRQLPTEGGVIASANVAWRSKAAAGGPTGTCGWACRRAGLAEKLGLSVGLLVVLLAVAEGIVRRRRRRRLGLRGTPSWARTSWPRISRKS